MVDGEGDDVGEGEVAVGAEALSIIGTGNGGTGVLRSLNGFNTWGGTVLLTGAGKARMLRQTSRPSRSGSMRSRITKSTLGPVWTWLRPSAALAA